MCLHRFVTFFVMTLVFTPAVTFGQEATSSVATTTDGGFFEAIIDRVENIGGDSNDTPEAGSLSPLPPRTQERLTNLAANISNRLEGLADRLENISLRLDRRIKKLEATGYNVAEAQTSLTAAKQSLQEARTSLSTIDKDVYDALRSPDPLTEWKTVRSTYIEARDSLRRSHTHLRETIASLKSATPLQPPEEATSTSPNNL